MADYNSSRKSFVALGNVPQTSAPNGAKQTRILRSKTCEPMSKSAKQIHWVSI
jgi:hypothetical protein